MSEPFGDAPIGPGVFVAVVGPSGAGKDTLINLAREALAEDPRFHFVRRLVTRTASPQDEDHFWIEPQAFDRMVASRACALSWRANGLGYALPLATDAAIAAGRVAIANLSRAAVEAARARYAFCAVVEITASREALLRRLQGRGRESAVEIEARLARSVAPVEGANVVRIDNGGAIAAARDQLVQVLLALAAAAPRPSGDPLAGAPGGASDR